MHTIQRPNISQQTPFSKFYILNKTRLKALTNELMTNTFLDNVKLLFSKPIENIVNLRVYPFDIASFVGSTTLAGIKINDITMTTKGFIVPDQVPDFLDMGSIFVQPQYMEEVTAPAFFDYEPYTMLQLYLPYIGFTDIPCQVVMGKNLSIKYAVDFATGECNAFLLVSEPGSTATTLFKTVKGQIGISIPIGGGQWQDIANNILKLSAGIVGTFAGASAGGAASLVAGVGVIGEAMNINTTPTVSGTLSNYNAYYGPQTCYLVYTRKKPILNQIFYSTRGRLSGLQGKLSDLKGFTMIDRVHMDGFPGATSEEITEIENLLKTGVILPGTASSYTITTTVTNGTYTGGTSIMQNETQTITITADSGYLLPERVTVTGAAFVDYNNRTGVIKVGQPTGNIIITVECIPIESAFWTVTPNITNGELVGDQEIDKEFTTYNASILPLTGYKLPETITVTGGTVAYNKTDGSFTITDITDNIVITAVCPQEVPLPTVYQIMTDITNGSLMDIPATVQQGGGAVSGTIQPNAGYVLPTSITVSGCSYTYDNVTGVITLSNYTGNIQIIGECVEEPQSTGTQDYYLKTNYDYVFKDTINYSSITNFERIRFEFPFHSNGNNFTAIEVAHSNSEFAGIYYEDTEANLTHVYTSSWSSEAYKTITPDIDGKSYRRLYNMNSQFLIDNFTEAPILGTFYHLSGTITGGTLINYDNYILGGSSSTTIGYNVSENHVATKTCNVTNATAAPLIDTKEFNIQNVTGDVVFNIICPEHQNNLSWRFKSSPKSLGAQGTSYSIGFTTNDTHFTILRNGTTFKEKFYLYYNDTEAYKSGWKNSNFRDIIFDTEPEQALLTYLQNNATLMS